MPTTTTTMLASDLGGGEEEEGEAVVLGDRGEGVGDGGLGGRGVDPDEDADGHLVWSQGEVAAAAAPAPAALGRNHRRHVRRFSRRSARGRRHGDGIAGPWGGGFWRRRRIGYIPSFKQCSLALHIFFKR